MSHCFPLNWDLSDDYSFVFEHLLQSFLKLKAIKLRFLTFFFADIDGDEILN